MHVPLSPALPEIYSFSLITPPLPPQDFLIFSDCTYLRVTRGSLYPCSSNIGKVPHPLRILALSHTAFTPISVIYWLPGHCPSSTEDLVGTQPSQRRQWQPTPVLLPGKSGELQSMGSRRVGHDWATSRSLFTFLHWRRKWQPTPVFLPGESQGWRSLVGCSRWGHIELDMTEAT